jgi:lipopolysaccharide export system permease protein
MWRWQALFARVLSFFPSTMLFHSSLRKELSRSFGATLVVLVTIVMTMMLIRTLGMAAGGSVNPSEILLVMAYTVLGYLPIVLALCLFISIVGTLSRMYRDSEMVIWFSSGRGLAEFLRPLFGFAWPILLLIAAFALVGWPWANSQTLNMRQRYERRSDIERVAPGEFRESASRLRVFFIDKDAPDSATASNVFISSIEGNQQTLTSARGGRMEDIDGKRFVLLSNGQRLERPMNAEGIKISEFETYGARIDSREGSAAMASLPRTRTTLTLLRDPVLSNLGELAWRLGLLLAGANFVLLALGLSSVNPRLGRSGNHLFALFAFVLYYNLINLSQSWVDSGKYGIGRLMLSLHGGAFLLGLFLLLKQHYNWRLLPVLRAPRTQRTDQA